MKGKSVIKILSIAVIASTLYSGTVFAAQGDIYDISDSGNIKAKYTSSEIGRSRIKQNELLRNASANGYELANGKIYSIEQINNRIQELYTQNPTIDNETLIDETFKKVQDVDSPIGDSTNLTESFDLENVY